VELRVALDVKRFKILPVVSAFVFIENGDCVVAVDQFQVCAKFKLSMVLIAVAGEIEESGVQGITAQLVLVPFVVRYLPVFPLCAGARALNAAVAVVAPVPPLAIGIIPVAPSACQAVPF
jgi:hypothetical protein